MCLPRDLTSTEAEYYMSRADAAWRVETKPFTPQKYEIIRTKELTSSQFCQTWLYFFLKQF